MLEIDSLSKRFGGLLAIQNLSLRVPERQFLGIVGANGAGKTTLINLITGYAKPTEGTIKIEGHEITGRKPYDICRAGVARTFQVVQPFMEMSVYDNVLTGALFSRKRRISIASARRHVDQSLHLVGLDNMADSPAGALTLGGKKKLELARALATQPKLLLLDEVMAGLTLTEVEETMTVLQRIHSTGTTIVMIEHLVHVIVKLSDYVFVLDFGRELFQGTPHEVIAHPEVIEAYLGKPIEEIGTA